MDSCLIPRLIILGQPGCAMATSQPGIKDVQFCVYVLGDRFCSWLDTSWAWDNFCSTNNRRFFETLIAAKALLLFAILAFWLILGEDRVYSCGKNYTFYIAPV